MQIPSILDDIDNSHMALPEFQRGYVWGREQVRGLFQSLYRGHPAGSLPVWATDTSTATHRGDGKLAPGVAKLLLDGQQRITSLYGVIRGKPPRLITATIWCKRRAKADVAFDGQPTKRRGDAVRV